MGSSVPISSWRWLAIHPAQQRRLLRQWLSQVPRRVRPALCVHCSRQQHSRLAAKEHTVNSILNTENAGDGPGSLDYDMDGSLLGYYPLVQMKRLDGKCVMVPRWLPEREANYVKYGVVECA